MSRPPHSPLSAPSQIRPARSSRKVVASSSSANVFRGEVVDRRIGHVPVPAIAIDGLGRPGHDDQACRSVPSRLPQPSHRGEPGSLVSPMSSSVAGSTLQTAAVAETREDCRTLARPRHVTSSVSIRSRTRRTAGNSKPRAARRRHGDQSVAEAQGSLKRVPVEVDGVIDDTAASEPNLASRRLRWLVGPVRADSRNMPQRITTRVRRNIGSRRGPHKRNPHGWGLINERGRERLAWQSTGVAIVSESSTDHEK